MILQYPSYPAGVILVLGLFLSDTNGKYVEGRLKTLDDWAFVARFCFLSGRGRYEYHIEFERRLGEPKLLLYYDDVTQWPSVYKSGKTCPQKLSVLSVIDNQIVTLSARSPYNILSGCTQQYKHENSNSPPNSKNSPPATVPSLDIDSTYYDQFIGTEAPATAPANGNDSGNSFDYEMFNMTFSGLNETVEFVNGSERSEQSHRIYLHDQGQGNSLENGTDYMKDVEELFGSIGNPDERNQTDRLRRHLSPIPNIFKKEKKGTIIVTCGNIGGFTSSRERWWYIAVSNCGSGKGIDITYQFRMTNGPPGDFWHEHFSADEMNIPPILLSLGLAYSLLLVAVFICAIELKSMHLFHCTYRLYSFSVILQWIGILLQSVAWAKYGLTGIGPHTTAGGLFIGASEVTFLALMLLLAKGYTITRARLSSASTIKLSTFINIYIVSYIALFIFQDYAFDPGEVLNLYESPAGLGLAGLRVIAWGAFLISMFNVIRKYPEKRTFYYPFGLLGSMWILGGPIATLFGIAILDAWVRESVMYAVLGLVAFTGHVSFLYITWPSRANKSFPYHVRTNHVGIASEDDDGADYPRHTYEPTLNNQNLIIPLSRRTEELLNGVYSHYLTQSQTTTATSVNNQHLSLTPSAPPLEPDRSSRNPGRSPMHPNENQQHHHHHHHHDFENQVDSGHPSLENSVSPNETRPSSGQESPNTLHSIPPSASRNYDPSDHDNGATLKPNPFIVNGIQRAPNKVILEPIENSIKEMERVPRHLFAAKRPV